MNTFNKMPSSTGDFAIMGMHEAPVKIGVQAWVSDLTFHLVGVSCHSLLAWLSDAWVSRTPFVFALQLDTGALGLQMSAAVSRSVYVLEIWMSVLRLTWHILCLFRHLLPTPTPCLCFSFAASVTGKSYATAVTSLITESPYLISEGFWVPPQNPY